MKGFFLSGRMLKNLGLKYKDFFPDGNSLPHCLTIPPLRDLFSADARFMRIRCCENRDGIIVYVESASYRPCGEGEIIEIVDIECTN